MTPFASLCRHGDLIVDLLPQAFSRRFPWHLQGACLCPARFWDPPPGWSTVFFVDFVEECMEMSLSDVERPVNTIWLQVLDVFLH